MEKLPLKRAINCDDSRVKKILTCKETPDEHGNHPIKLDGVVIGHVRQEKKGPQSGLWLWYLYTVQLEKSTSGVSYTKEIALQEIKEFGPVLLKQQRK